MNHSDENNNYEVLAAKWVDGSISAEERRKFNDWYLKDQEKPLIVPASFATDAEMHKERIYQKVLAGLEKPKLQGRRRLLWMGIAAAASICVLLAIGLYLQNSKSYDLDELARTYGHGSHVAVLTDQNGKEYLLEDSVFNISSEAHRFGSNGNGSIKITTPRGSRFQVLLEDGTKIWLGAASSIVSPIRFRGGQRSVDLSGEAYFDVAHRAYQPFHVTIDVRRQLLNVVVLGTEFSLRAYHEDEELQARVFEGSVKLSSGNQSAILVKGEKVIFKNGRLQPKMPNQDDDWLRAGTLHFDNDDMRQVARMLAREYDLMLAHNGIPPGEMYVSGEISRKRSLKEVIEIVEYATDYRFLLENRSLKVYQPRKSN